MYTHIHKIHIIYTCFIYTHTYTYAKAEGERANEQTHSIKEMGQNVHNR